MKCRGKQDILDEIFRIVSRFLAIFHVIQRKIDYLWDSAYCLTFYDEIIMMRPIILFSALSRKYSAYFQSILHHNNGYFIQVEREREYVNKRMSFVSIHHVTAIINQCFLFYIFLHYSTGYRNTYLCREHCVRNCYLYFIFSYTTYSSGYRSTYFTLCREHCVNVIYLFVQPGDAGKKCFGGILFGSGSDFQS